MRITPFPRTILDPKRFHGARICLVIYDCSTIGSAWPKEAAHSEHGHKLKESYCAWCHYSYGPQEISMEVPATRMCVATFEPTGSTSRKFNRVNGMYARTLHTRRNAHSILNETLQISTHRLEKKYKIRRHTLYKNYIIS